MKFGRGEGRNKRQETTATTIQKETLDIQLPTAIHLD